MAQIWLSGDCHGDFRRFNTTNFPEQKELTKSDVVIVAGDCALLWNSKEETKEEKYNLDLMESRNFTFCYIDGNHEGFDSFKRYPVVEWNGGLVHEIRPSVLHLMRGQVFNIDGCKIFTFGGARSHDIQGGVLNIDDPEFSAKRKKADKAELPYRVNHISWWDEEMPSEEEMQIGRDNLEKNDWKVDYIVTHDCASSTLAMLGMGSYKVDELNKYLEEIKHKCDYKRWLFGHHHLSKQITAEDIVLYEQIIRIW